MRSITCEKDTQKIPASSGNCLLDSHQPNHFLHLTLELIQAQSPHVITQKVSDHNHNLSTSSFIILSEQGLKISIEGLSARFGMTETSPSANSQVSILLAI